ncbi:hypothetical protein [Photobacterium leiognathi]|uniref:hypothetical protein n=1 Tax=Photobacterium leiognathi TaxID=553611 RepID=UPI0029826C15|nr:hypothetical protein [Photobacterium leiognathi]
MKCHFKLKYSVIPINEFKKNENAINLAKCIIKEIDGFNSLETLETLETLVGCIHLNSLNNYDMKLEALYTIKSKISNHLRKYGIYIDVYIVGFLYLFELDITLDFKL